MFNLKKLHDIICNLAQYFYWNMGFNYCPLTNVFGLHKYNY